MLRLVVVPGAGVGGWVRPAGCVSVLVYNARPLSLTTAGPNSPYWANRGSRRPMAGSLYRLTT